MVALARSCASVWCVQLTSTGLTNHVVCDSSPDTAIKCVIPKQSVVIKKSAETSQLVWTPSLFKIGAGLHVLSMIAGEIGEWENRCVEPLTVEWWGRVWQHIIQMIGIHRIPYLQTTSKSLISFYHGLHFSVYPFINFTDKHRPLSVYNTHQHLLWSKAQSHLTPCPDNNEKSRPMFTCQCTVSHFLLR